MGRRKKDNTANAEKKTTPKNALPEVGDDFTGTRDKVLAILSDTGLDNMPVEMAKWGYAFIVISVLIEPLKILKSEDDKPCNAKGMPFDFRWYGSDLERVLQWAEWRLAQCAEKLKRGAANG